MMARKKRSVSGASTHREFTKAAHRQGGWTEPGSKHDQICHPDGGKVAIPRHKGDLARGTRASIIKALIGLGFVVLGIAAAAVLYPDQFQSLCDAVQWIASA